MEHLILELRDQNLALAAQPVTRQEFSTYLSATGQPQPAPLTKRSSAAPITNVSQVQAQAYCRWLSTREGRRCHLPALAELHWLAAESARQEAEKHQITWGRLPAPERSSALLSPAYLCEWAQEIAVLPQNEAGAAECSFGSIFYPLWSWSSSRTTHIQANLAVDVGYSFITFRVAYDLVKR